MERRVRVNEQIRAPKIRVVGPDGRQIGIMAVREALNLAREHDLDLIEVAPTADPPVCRIMDYGRHRYESRKREREASKKQRLFDLKTVRFKTANIDQHDLDTKVRRMEKFLKEKKKVRLTVWFRGREMARVDRGRDLLLQIADRLAEVSSIQSAPTLEGRNMNMTLAPRGGKANAKDENK